MSKQIVLLAGWGLGAAPLQGLAQALLAVLPDYSVQVQMLPNMDGHDTAAIIQQLDQQLPSDCWLLGWSLGGMLASALAALRQSRCAGVISCASNACFVARDDWSWAMPAATFAQFYELCRSNPAAGLQRFAMLCSQGAVSPRQVARQLQEGVSIDAFADQLAALQVLAELDNCQAIRQFSGPQLHFLAQADALVPLAATTQIRELNTQAQVEVLGLSHASVCVEPQLFAQRISDFIQGESYA